MSYYTKNPVADAARFMRDQEAAHEGACLETALHNGHTAQEAEECDDQSVGCPDCPFAKHSREPA